MRDDGVTGRSEIAEHLCRQSPHPPVGVREACRSNQAEKTRFPLNPPQGAGNLQAEACRARPSSASPMHTKRSATASRAPGPISASAEAAMPLHVLSPSFPSRRRIATSAGTAGAAAGPKCSKADMAPVRTSSSASSRASTRGNTVTLAAAEALPAIGPPNDGYAVSGFATPRLRPDKAPRCGRGRFPGSLRRQ